MGNDFHVYVELIHQNPMFIFQPVTVFDSNQTYLHVLLRLKCSSCNNCSSQEVNERNIPSHRQCEFGIKSTF